MRVLMVTRESDEDRRYGLGRSLAPVLNAMAAAGIDARYFCAEDVDATTHSRRHAFVERWSRRWPFAGRPHRANLLRALAERLHIGWIAAELARREGYTHVHAHDPWLAAGVALCLRRHGAHALRWGFTEHGFGSYARATHQDGLEQGPVAQWLLHRVEAAVAAAAHWVTMPTRAALNELARDLSRRQVPAHWRHVPHARPPLGPPTAEQRDAARAGFGWQRDDLVVLAVGRLVPLKCFDRVLQACAAQSHHGVHLQLLGGGDPAPFQALAAELGFAGRLRIESTQDVRPYYHAADVYLSASSTEAFGLANLEALCAGLPAVCSAVGGVPEVVADGAWLVPNDTASLTSALGTLVRDPEARRRWSEHALARAAGWPDPDTIARKYVAIYEAA